MPSTMEEKEPPTAAAGAATAAASSGNQDDCSILEEIKNQVQGRILEVATGSSEQDAKQKLLFFCKNKLGVNLPEGTYTNVFLVTFFTYHYIVTEEQSRLMALCMNSPEEFYKRFLHECIQSVWNQVSQWLGASRKTKINNDIGFTLLTHGSGRDIQGEGKFDVPIGTMYSKVIKYGEYLIEKLNKAKCNKTVYENSAYVSFGPTTSNLNEFLESSRSDVSDKSAATETNHDDLNNSEDSASPRPPSFATFGRILSTQRADTVAKLLPFLPTAHLEDGKLVMSREDCITLLTAPYVVSRHLVKLQSKLKPLPGKFVPLDKLAAGANSENHQRMSQEPSIKIYMQQQENNALHHSNVFVLRDFLSDEIMQKWQEMENELSFQAQTNSDKYLRVASRVFDPPPLVTFGNDQNNLRLYEATQTKGIEEIIGPRGPIVTAQRR